MNSSEQTTVATLAVFFALIFLLIMITMCCILRRGCRKETTQEGHKRYRFRSDWDKSGTMTSSETRITEAVPGATDNSISQAAGNDRGTTGALVRIEEETTAETYSKTEETARENEAAGVAGNATTEDDENTFKKHFVELSCESDEHKRLIDGETTSYSFATGLSMSKKSSDNSASKGKEDKHLSAMDDAELSSNCSVGESLKDLMVVE